MQNSDPAWPLGRWPAFKHEPFDSSGFNPLVLPFEFSGSGTNETGREEALAFSFLLSNALDWMPGNYCTRHAYFIFKRARHEVQAAAQTCDPAAIAALMRAWNSTHALGGKLVRIEKGYAGNLKVFDSSGKQVLFKTYEVPCDYFSLLAVMSADAMRVAGFEPSPALIAHLGVKRCNDFQSILDLGAAAFADERSGDEFRLYRQILNRDPDFAEVRYWAMNQSFWAAGGQVAGDRQYSTMLKSYLIPAILGYYSLPAAPGSGNEEISQYAKWIGAAEELAGPDSPIVLSGKLKIGISLASVDTNLWDRVVIASRKYPNNYQLLGQMISLLDSQEAESPADCDLLGGLGSAALESRYLFGDSSGERGVVRTLATAANQLGQHRLAFRLWSHLRALTVDAEPDTAIWYAEQCASSLRQMGMLDRAFEARTALYDQRVAAGMPGERAAADACIAASLLGREDLLTAMLKRCESRGMPEGYDPLITGYLDLLKQGSLSPSQFRSVLQFISRDQWSFHESILLLAFNDFVSGQSKFRADVRMCLEVNPNDRELWMLYDAYDRRDPTDEAWCFYEALEWLFRGDPGVEAAVAARNKRRPKLPGAERTNLLTVMTQLRSYTNAPRWPTDLARPTLQNANPPAMPAEIRAKPILPGSVAVAVRDLLEEGDTASAREIVLRYQLYAASFRYPSTWYSRGYALRAYCNHLYHLVEQTASAPRQINWQ